MDIAIKQGIAFDIYRNTLILLRISTVGDYFADDIHYSFEERKWVLLNTWAFSTVIQDV